MELSPGSDGEARLTLQNNREIGTALTALRERAKSLLFNSERKRELQHTAAVLSGVFSYQLQNSELGENSPGYRMEPEASILTLDAMRWLVKSKKHRSHMSMDTLELALSTIEDE